MERLQDKLSGMVEYVRPLQAFDGQEGWHQFEYRKEEEERREREREREGGKKKKIRVKG